MYDSLKSSIQNLDQDKKKMQLNEQKSIEYEKIVRMSLPEYDRYIQELVRNYQSLVAKIAELIQFNDL